MAMAVGDGKHYRVDEIMPRHFVQSAAKAGLPATLPMEVAEELISALPQAIDDTRARLPPDFPESLITSVTKGVHSRLKQLAAE